MSRGLVLPFPSPQRLTADDYESLQRFAAACPEAQIDIIIARDCREIAILALDGRQLWIVRNKTGVELHDGSNGQMLGKDTCTDSLLAAIHAALLPGGTTSKSEVPGAFRGLPSHLAHAGG